MTTKIVLWLSMCVLLGVEGERGQTKVVQLAQGSVRGHKDPSSGVFVFSGIPYATVPTGSDRYKAPFPPPVWDETFDAVDEEIICPQVISGFLPMASKKIKEDCLIANVYVPDTTEENLPVLISVHGGGFQGGWGDIFKYKYFSQSRNIISITFNYRVGVLGFLCLGTDNIPGNAGMKDQIALLRWVRKNVASFGGDPDKVTLIGNSAGSAAVDLLQLSPAARGLFTKVIPESGSNVATFTLQPDPLNLAKKHAQMLNFTNVDDVYALEKFYTSTPYDVLISVVHMDNTDGTLGFSPCVERPTNQEIFLSDSPVKIIKSGNYMKVPMLYGFANMEGITWMMWFDARKDKMNQNFADFLPADLKFDSEAHKQEVANKVKEFYFRDKDVNEDTMFGYIKYYSDIVFAYPALRTLKLQYQAGNKDIYLYEYSFVDVGGTPLGYKDYTTDKGASHGQETAAVADGMGFITSLETNLPEDFIKIKKNMREMYYNFITQGEPVPEGSSLPTWPAMGEDWSPHMSLGNTVELRLSLLQDRARFWEDIYERHYQHPQAPPAPPNKRTEL